MKKSLINIITLALSLVNLIFMVVIVFAIVPTMNNTNQLITKICTAVDLELENSQASGEDITNIPFDKLDTYNISGDPFVFNLKEGQDGISHVIILKVYLNMNKGNKDYEKYYPTLANTESLFRSAVINTVSNYSMEEMKANTDIIRAEILKQIQDIYKSDFIIEVGFSDIKYQ